MFEYTGCDAVMIGRAALGNPWFFKEAVAIYEGRKIPSPPTISIRIDGCKNHFVNMIKWHGEKTATNLMRKHFGWYLRGFEGASSYRQSLVSCLLYTSPSPRDRSLSRMPSSA